MKKLILTSFIILIYVCSFGQTFQWGYNSIFDSLYLEDSDTLEQFNLDPSTKDFDWVYGINYGDIDSSEVLLYIQGSIPGFGWVTISDTVTLDSTNTERVFYITGDTPNYPSLKFIMERDEVDTTLDGWIKTGWYTRKLE